MHHTEEEQAGAKVSPQADTPLGDAPVEDPAADPTILDTPISGPSAADPAPARAPARRTPTPQRQSRCANHPGAASVGTCQICGQPLCITCAVLVRGALVGPECLPAVLEDAPAPDPRPARAQHRGDWPALAGFGFVVLLSAFPWARFGGSGFFDAWTRLWSLLAVAGAVAGFAITLAARRWRHDPRLVAPTLAVLALVVGGGAILTLQNPPPLSEASPAPWLAILGAGLALLGAISKAIAAMGAPRVQFLTP